jgi:hypothetical protein
MDYIKLLCIGGVSEGRFIEVPDCVPKWRVLHNPVAISFPHLDPPSGQIEDDQCYELYVVEGIHIAGGETVKFLRHEHITLSMALHRLIHHYKPPGFNESVEN